MIERYSISSTPEQLRERFAIDVPDFYKPSYNAAPTKLLPVITNTGSKGLSTFYWGETPGWAKNKTPGEKIINVRIETLTEKTALRKSMVKTRCLVPADGFYAMKRIGKKSVVPYRFVLQSGSLFSIPGLWEEYEDVDGQETHTFTIFTKPADALVAQVQDRMPVMFTREAELNWLKPEATEQDLVGLMYEKADLPLNYYPVSPRVLDINVDVPSLLTPTPPADQFGNLTLFD